MLLQVWGYCYCETRWWIKPFIGPILSLNPPLGPTVIVAVIVLREGLGLTFSFVLLTMCMAQDVVGSHGLYRVCCS